MNTVQQRYQDAKEQFAAIGVDTEKVLSTIARIPISVHCWQGDDVMGFEGASALTGGIMTTGNYPGRARTPLELRADLEKVFSLVPGTMRCNLHASYLEAGGKAVDRDAIEPQHFQNWIDWAKAQNIRLDFNPTFFSHPQADSGFTLSAADPAVRAFWVEHSKRCRTVAAAIGKAQGGTCYHNFWIPDGYKDHSPNKLRHREWLIESYDEIFKTPLPGDQVKDAVESKLFGLGSEAYVVGSHEFYLAYAVSRKVLLTMDAGHYHPTELISEKISAILPFTKELLLHVSRPMRWDSDHVVIMDDPTKAIMQEIVRAGATETVHVALDFFDASINRIAAWTIGVRSTLKSLLVALLEPTERIRTAESAGNFARRLALMEESASMPWGAVWDQFCESAGVPVGEKWIDEVEQYETAVLTKRSVR